MSGARTAPEALPDPTRIEGAPHPRETRRLFGQARAEAGFLEALATGRLHHGWLLSGPRGVGKATLAWRAAKFLLSTADGTHADSLDCDPEAPAVRRILAGAEPGVFELHRGANATGSALSRDIRVDEVRRLKSFLHLSATEGGRRVVIVDCADDLNPQAANALLKLLEEPPARVIFFLIAHQPAGLLPTIRSRCRELRLATLGAEDIARALAQVDQASDDGPQDLSPSQTAALAALAAGSVGEAVRLSNLGGLEQYQALVALFATLPRLDRPRALALAESAAARGKDAQLDLLLDLFERFLSRCARAGVTGPPRPEAAPEESRLLARLSPDQLAAMRWADLHQSVLSRARHGQGVNLDPAALVMDMILQITAAAS